MSRPKSDQFEKAPGPFKNIGGCKAVVTVVNDSIRFSGHFAIAAPSVEILQQVWDALDLAQELDTRDLQRAVIIKDLAYYEAQRSRE